MLGNVALHQIFDELVAHADHGFVDRFRAHELQALLEDRLALIVHHIVEFEQILADVEVARLNPLLRFGDRGVDHAVRDRLALFQAQALQHAVKLVLPEDAHQIVMQAQIEFRMTGIALPARAAAQLIVDTPAFVPFGAEHVEPAGLDDLLLRLRDLGADLLRYSFLLGFVGDANGLDCDAHVRVAAELNVGAAAGHIGGDGDAGRHARLADNLRFHFVIARVQNVVLDLLFLENGRQCF